MNREIKFRGQRVDNGEIVHGDLIHGVNHKKGKTYILPVRGGVMALGHGLDPMDGYEVIPETVGQLTGLKDKNGTEIYEGDIVKRTAIKYDWDRPDGRWGYDVEETSFIIYRNNGFWVEAEHFGWEGESLWDWDKTEVIGNIYQNKELLTKTQIQ